MNKVSFLITRGVSEYKDVVFQYKDPDIKDKMVLQLSYLNIGIPIPGKDGLYIETRPCSMQDD